MPYPMSPIQASVGNKKGVVVNFILPIYPGLTCFTLPFEPLTPYTSKTLLDAMHSAGGNITEVSRWINDGWSTYAYGLPFGFFNIELGKGYLIRNAGETVFNFQFSGRKLNAGVTLSLGSGLNYVGFPYPESGFVAQSLLVAINAQGGTSTAISQFVNEAWVSHGLGVPFNNFDILPYKGYMVNCTSGSTFTPGA